MTSASPAGKPLPASMHIALIGDLHTYSLAVWPWELLGKPLAGQLNLWLNRRTKFDRSLIAPTIARVLECNPDLALLSGDLTTTSRPREFRSMIEALRPLTSVCETVMIAGNHDRYTFTAQRSRRIERAFTGCAPEVFPFSRPLIGGWRLIAVDSAVPRLLDSRGCIGQRQMQHAQSLLQSLGDDEGVVILCHYPFGKPPQLPPMKPGHQLIDEREWKQTIAECRGRVIIVHGHVHCPWLWRPQLEAVTSAQPMPRVLDINAGSPTMTRGGWPRGQGFWTMELHPDPSRAIALSHHVMGRGDPPVGAPNDDSMSMSDATGAPEWRTRSFSLTI